MARRDLIHEELTYSVIGAFFEVYNTLGYGFLESIYARALELELIARGHRVEREVVVRVYYKGQEVGLHRLDMVIDEKLIVENKSTHTLHKEAPRQAYNYLKSTDLEVGLLFHYGPEPGFFRLICRNAR